MQSALATLMVLAYFTAAHCFNPPNPTPTPKSTPTAINDRVPARHTRLALLRWTMRILGTYHALLTLLYPRSQSQAQSQWATLCPKPTNTSAQLFTWTTYTLTFLLLIISAGCMRITAYAQLGRDFTYELSAPKRLVTTGFYRYMRHPAYTGAVVVLLSTVALLGNARGALGCLLPGVVARWSPLLMVLQLVYWVRVIVSGVSARCEDEEVMMKKTFGDEWVRYAARTKRFVPGVL